MCLIMHVCVRNSKPLNVWGTERFASHCYVNLRFKCVPLVLKSPPRKWTARPDRAQLPASKMDILPDNNSTTNSKTPPPGANLSTLGAKPLYIPLIPSSRANLIKAGYVHSPAPRSWIRVLTTSTLTSARAMYSGRYGHSSERSRTRSVQGVLIAVPTKPPMVPAIKLLVSSAFLVCSVSYRVHLVAIICIRDQG